MKDKIVEQVITKFSNRSQLGIKKYGTTLDDNNTDDFLEHLQQELMDAVLYIEKLKSLRRFLVIDHIVDSNEMVETSAKKQITKILDDLDYRYDLLTGDADWLMNEIRSRLENVTDQVPDVRKMVEISDIDIKKKRWEDWDEFNRTAGYSEESSSPYADGFTRGAKWILKQLNNK